MTTQIRTQEEIVAELQALQAENAILRAKAERLRNHKLTTKISEKGAVSVYGLGRFPVTLYREQWEKLFNIVEDMKDFIAANSGKLTSKQ
jgi:hypothetical protein